MNQETPVLKILNEKDLVVALATEFLPEDALTISNVVEAVLRVRLPQFTNKTHFDREVQKSYFSIKLILGEAVRYLASQQSDSDLQLALKLQLFLDSYEVEGVFFMKNFKFAAVSTLVIGEETFFTDEDGALTTIDDVDFDVQPVSLFTSMLIDFLGKGDKFVRFSYKTIRIKGKTHTKPVLDPEGAFKALDLRTELIVCEVSKEGESSSVIAQQAIVNGFKARVEGMPLVIASYQFKSASQGRQGKWVSGQLFKDDQIISFVDFLMSAGLNLLSLAKDKGDAVVVDLMKDSTRAPLMASSGKLLTVLNDMAAKLVSKKVSDSLTTLDNGRFSIAILDDIEIVVEDSKYYALDKKTGTQIAELSSREVLQVLNDGVTMMDAETYRKFIAAELGYTTYGENTFRMTSGIVKGLIIPRKGLKEKTGYDMITTKGNAKGFAAFGDGIEFNPLFTIVIQKDGEKAHRFDQRWIPFQVSATNMFDRSTLLKKLTENINDYNGAMNLDVDSKLFRTMFSDAVENEASLEGLYNTVLKALDANASYSKHPYISYCMTKMLDFYAKELRRGKVRVNGRFSVMAQDVELYTYVLEQNLKAELKGESGVYKIRRNDQIVKDFEAADGKVIEAGTIVTPDGTGKRSYVGDVVANRFPLTHHLQSVLIKAVDNTNYNELFEEGFYHSLIIFSAFDIVLISMAGADCDGDMCLVIIDPELVAAYKKGQPDRYAIDRTAIVDKYVDLDNSIQDGVPYKSVEELSFDLSKYPGFSYETDNGNAFAVRIQKDVFTRMTKQEIELVLHEINKQVAARTIDPAQVGKFTNHIMCMTQNVEDLRARAKTGNRSFVRLDGKMVTYMDGQDEKVLEYPEYMGTRVDSSGNVVGIPFAEWATQEANAIEENVLAWQWVLQYELDKDKHGGSFARAMMLIMDSLNNPLEGCRVLIGVDAQGNPLWEEAVEKGKKVKGKFVYRKPTWLDKKANNKSRILFTNIESLRLAADKHLTAIDARVTLKNMSNVSELALEFSHHEENQVEFQQLANGLHAIYKEYNSVVSKSSRAYDDGMAKLSREWNTSLKALESYNTKSDILIGLIDNLKDTRQDAISNATAASSIEIAEFESRYALSLKDSTRAVLHIVYNLVNTATRVKENTNDFSSSQAVHDLVKGLAFFWTACMPQIAKVSGNPLYAAYLEKAKGATTHRPAGAEFSIGVKLDTGFQNLADRFVAAIGNGNPVELTARKFSDVITPNIFVDFEGGRHSVPGVTYNRYELYLTLTNGNELLVGYIKDDSIFMLNGFEEATITLNNGIRDQGRQLHFIKSTDVVITQK